MCAGGERIRTAGRCGVRLNNRAREEIEGRFLRGSANKLMFLRRRSERVEEGNRKLAAAERDSGGLGARTKDSVRFFAWDGIVQHNRHMRYSSPSEFLTQKFLDKTQHKLIFSLPLRRPVWAFEGLTGHPFRKNNFLSVPARYSVGSDSSDSPIEDPPYYTYIDPHSGEPTPTFGSRSSIPSKEFWSEDTAIRVRSAQAGLPSDKSISTSKSSHGKNPGSRRKRFKERTKASESLVGKAVEHESTSKNSNYLSEEELEDTSTEPVIQQPETSEVEIDEEELARKYGEPHPFIRPNSQKKALKGQLANEELWWNWRKSPDGKEQWSAWHKPRGNVDTVMAAAMAETGQIKLFGEKPTIAEAALARARKHVFYKERLQAEEDRKAEIGPMAYYQEWVKAWKKDTSKEAVQKHFEETGEDVSVQLLNMFQHQTDREYRIMMGTDIRIRRDPLTMRMRPELKKAVYGGDPVYPTINYIQDPDHVVDYRGANFHEPVPDILDVLRQRGRLISRDDLAKKLAKEKAEALETNELDDAMAGAVDIGENDEDDEDEDDEDEIPDWSTAGSSVSSLSSREAGSKSKGSQNASAFSDSEKAILKDFSNFSLFDDSED